MEMRWTRSMEMRWWVTSTTKCRSKSQRRILFKIKSRKLSRFVQTMMHFLETLSSQLMINLFTMIHQTLQSMLWTCLQLSGKDLRKLLQKSHWCLETKWAQETSSKESLETAGSSDLFLSKALIQSSWRTWSYITVSSMDLQYSNSSKTDAGNT